MLWIIAIFIRLLLWITTREKQLKKKQILSSSYGSFKTFYQICKDCASTFNNTVLFQI